MFRTNEGRTDRIVRVAAGLALVALGASGVVGGIAGTVLLIAGVVLLVTGVVGWCPAYALLGFDTCPRDPHERHGLGLIHH